MDDLAKYGPAKPGDKQCIDTYATVSQTAGFLENATVRGRDWYKLLDALALTLDVTV